MSDEQESTRQESDNDLCAKADMSRDGHYEPGVRNPWPRWVRITVYLAPIAALILTAAQIAIEIFTP